MSYQRQVLGNARRLPFPSGNGGKTLESFELSEVARECLWRIGWFIDEAACLRVYPLSRDRVLLEQGNIAQLLRMVGALIREIRSKYDVPVDNFDHIARTIVDVPPSVFNDRMGLSSFIAKDTLEAQMVTEDAALPIVFPVPPRLAGPHISESTQISDYPKPLKGEVAGAMTAQLLVQSRMVSVGRICIVIDHTAISNNPLPSTIPEFSFPLVRVVQVDGEMATVCEVEDFNVETGQTPNMFDLNVRQLRPLLSPREGVYWDVPVGELVFAFWPFTTTFYPAYVNEPACASNGYIYHLTFLEDPGSTTRHVHAFWVVPADRRQVALMVQIQQQSPAETV